MATESFVFLRSFEEAAQQLDDELRLQFYNALILYGLFGELPEDVDPVVKALVILCAPNIDSAKSRRENGKKGGAPTGNQNARKTTKKQPKTTIGCLKNKGVENKTTEYIYDVDVDVDVENKEKSKPEKKARFARPSFQDVSDYCHEKGYVFDTNRFYDYYESNGWMVGKNPMKDWKAAVRSWASREHPPEQKKYGNYMQRSTVDDIGTEYISEVTS